MTGLITVGLSVIATVAGTALFVYGISTFVWFVWKLVPGGQMRFPNKTAIVLTVLISLGGLVREAGSWGPVLAGYNSAQVGQLVSVFNAASAGQLNSYHVSPTVADLRARGWGAGAKEAGMLVVSFRGNRYMDLMQSWYEGEVVRTPVGAVPRYLEEAIAAAEATWTPLLIAAAEGNNVEFEGGTVVGPAEIYFLSLSAASARYEVLAAMERHYGLDVPLSDADRSIGPTLAWAPNAMAYAEAPGSQQRLGSWGYAADLIFSTRILPGAIGAIAEGAGLVGHPDASAYMAYNYETIKVDLQSSLALMQSALGGSSDIDWTSLNDSRRLLGQPVIDPVLGVQVAESTGRLPWQLDFLEVSAASAAKTAADLEELEARWALVQEVL